jgi:hypothetical protein
MSSSKIKDWMRKDRTIEKEDASELFFVQRAASRVLVDWAMCQTDAPWLAVDCLISARDVVNFETIATLHTRKNETLS